MARYKSTRIQGFLKMEHRPEMLQQVLLRRRTPEESGSYLLSQSMAFLSQLRTAKEVARMLLEFGHFTEGERASIVAKHPWLKESSDV